MDSVDLYPPGPADVPRGLTRPGLDYRLRAAAMIGGLFLFLALYLALIATAGVFAYEAALISPTDARGEGILWLLVMKVGGPLAAGLLCLFLIKGLFKGHTVERANHVPLKEEEHPELFEFIHRVYREVGAPAPRRVVASPDVNAALIYDSSLLNLVIPPEKDLLIGLGLVNVLTLTEFKAVLAHEFGHFAQKSVGLGSYLYIANQVMHDVIYGRDALDRFVDRWAELDVRISFPALGLQAALSGVRWMLGGLYHGLNLMHLSLSRQMEFNADNVAVSVTGSDALINALARFDFGHECLADAAKSLNAAADHGLFTDDLFYHQSQAAERLRRVRKNPNLGVPPETPEGADKPVWVFRPEKDGIPDKYRSHPTNYAREGNAKQVYIPGLRDDRSPWLLFGAEADLRRDVTEVCYSANLNRTEKYCPKPAAEVQPFIDAETAETTYDARYQGWYDNRLINAGDVELTPLKAWPPEKITSWLANWPPPDLGGRSERIRELQEDVQVLKGIGSGAVQIQGSTFEYRNHQYGRHHVPRLVADVEAELERTARSSDELDRQAFEAHWSLAKHLDKVQAADREAELRERYRFHMAVQRQLGWLLGVCNQLQGVIHFLGDNPELEKGDFREVRSTLQGIQQALTEAHTDARRIKTPELSNVPAGTPMSELIADRSEDPLVGLYSDKITDEYLTRLAVRLDTMVGRLRRMHFKSLGALLAFQERIASEWSAIVPAPSGRPREVATSSA
ncbi:MAG TPA: M48 family metallopeptidase [Gemmataceae bacterium]|nr:M48 family metallopeptidase [Gemmataceae bacterium]